jgi:hypothetical protein
MNMVQLISLVNTNKSSDSIKSGEFDQMSSYQLLKRKYSMELLVIYLT